MSRSDLMTRFWLLLVVAILLSFGMVLVGVLADDDDGPLSVTTNDEWYRLGEIIVYNVSADPGTKIHVMILTTEGGIYHEVFTTTDENGSFENGLSSDPMWAGSWYVEVFDLHNNSAKVKFLLIMDSQGLADEDEKRAKDVAELVAFLWMYIAMLTGVCGFGVLAFMGYSSLKRAEITGEKTWMDSLSMHARDLFKFPYEMVGISKRGRQDSHLMTKKTFNEVRWKIDDNNYELNWCRAEALNFDTIHPDVGPKLKKLMLNRFRTRIEWLMFENSVLEPKLEKYKENLKKSYIRQGLWTTDMSNDEKDALLYPGEERTLVRDSRKATDEEIEIELARIKRMKGVELGKKKS